MVARGPQAHPGQGWTRISRDKTTKRVVQFEADSLRSILQFEPTDYWHPSATDELFSRQGLAASVGAQTRQDFPHSGIADEKPISARKGRRLLMALVRILRIVVNDPCLRRTLVTCTVSSWESEEPDERLHALFLTAARKSPGSGEFGDTVKARPK